MATLTGSTTVSDKAVSPGRKAWMRFRRHQLAMTGLVLFSIILLLSAFAPVFDRYPPNKLNLRDKFQPPSATHYLGTDRVGRDIWSRTLHGGRVSLTVGFAAALVAMTIGVVLGALSGYYGGLVDMLIMRFTDVVMTFPQVVIILTVATFVGQGLLNVILLIGLFSWPPTARLVRGQVLSLREEQFVKAARSLGASDGAIIFKHILPSVIAPLLASLTFAINGAVLLEAGLSFLGVGIPLPTASWGNMLETARSLDVLQDGPWMWIPPAIMILLNVLSVNFIGDGLRDALDPKHII
ncbi:MAG: ABC transporter permease [Trueperaceae bacterium]|nr:MAG: ABC transporter permease [Trueperaceae bacterium]